jgi:hypothetical protein
MAGRLREIDVAGLFFVWVKDLFFFFAPLDRLGQRDQDQGSHAGCSMVEPTYCQGSCPLQAAWGAMDLAVQKSSPLQVVDVG